MQSPVTKRVAAAAVLTILLTMAGCASTGGIAPQASRTDAASLDAGNAIRAAAADAQWPAADWWRTYRDPQLDAWIEAALAGNPSLAAAQARVREAMSMAGVARSALAPQVNADLSIKRQKWADNLYYGPGPLAGEQSWNNTGTLALSYHLDLWGKDRNAAERALDAAHASAADARAAQLELQANVVRTYIEMSLNYALLDIARATLEQQQQIADLAHRRLKGGIGTQLEVSQAETPLPEYERQIDALEEKIALGRNQLAALAGKGPGAGDSLQRPALSLAAPAGLPAALPAELIGHRPDVVAARWSVAAQARGIDVAKAGFYPDIDLLASIGGYAAMGPLFQFLKNPSHSWSAGPALSLPIFDGGRLRAQLGAATASYDEAVQQYNQTIVGALKDISDQVIRMRSLTTQAQDAERSVAAARKNYELSREGYRRGLTDYVNVLIAQNQLLRAQEGLAKVQAERLGAHASLVTALGGGLDEPHNGPRASQTLPGQREGEGNTAGKDAHNDEGNAAHNEGKGRATSQGQPADSSADVGLRHAPGQPLAAAPTPLAARNATGAHDGAVAAGAPATSPATY
ncbi:efflux transporter outer membrane subunit [bacterium M00.F.Ca.ET.228.01.1.1]|uniref:efflux transporter outer membrane subunit n=1 Tax=Paraburkholderia phenoliruptrix TaxID=252970 RepID=UPI0010929E30|nr:efflux transporter outer membrane subunit [Paraburkholderia phenoliruptrix]MBW9101014.1 efflux transporter outer membrane subunit [Paraburkholderia phenoliruptrix]TGP41135.1 efflux transporter outer membrane subunit [bacterium M00.F.Ca.ET.228.01.1.1]TGR97573.1 efflux transporter outer membrane subunit [bacterium M00.F.Ca.ET.191.01.1.1]TGU09230.1 efflux transporter outer membrane subunit [bacterium M00.F.Ca.ET.155.01.1.1]